MFGFNSSKLETSQDNPAYYHIISDVIADLPRLSSTGVSGYFHSMPIEGSSHYRMNFGFLVFVLNEQQSSLLQALEPTLALIERESSLDFSISTGHFSSYLDFQSNFLTAAPVGANRITVSRLWDKAAVIDKAGVVKVLRSFSNYVLQGTVVSGQGVSIRPANNNGLNPAWRHTAVHMSKWTRCPSFTFEKANPPRCGHYFVSSRYSQKPRGQCNECCR